MRVKRFSFSQPGNKPGPGDIVILDKGQGHQAVTVLRLGPGDEIELVGPWGLARAEVEKVTQQPWPTLTAKLVSPFEAPVARLGPTLALALIKGPRFDWAVEKATELGAAALVPLITLRSSPLAQGEAKKARWARLSEEARKQCGRPWPMDITAPMGLESWLGGPLAEERLLLDPGGPFLPCEAGKPASLLVGPEGGLTGDEKELALGYGFRPFGLGSLTLRSETAAVATLARLLSA